MLNIPRKLFDLLDARERRRFWLLSVMVLAMGVANMAGVAAVLPFLSVLSDPGVIHSNPWLSAAYERLGFADDRSFLIALGAGAAAAFFASIVVRVVTSYALFRFGALRIYSVSARLLRGYLRQPYDWFLNRHSSDLVKTVLTEVAQTVGGVIMPLLNMLANLAVALGLVALLVLVDPMASLIMLLVMGGGYALVFAVARPRLQRAGRRRYAANQRRFRVAQEALSGIKEVKVLGLEDSVMRRYRKPALTVAEAAAISKVLDEVPRHLLQGVAFGGMMLVLLILLILENGSLSAVLPVAGVYAVAGMRLTPALQAVYSGFTQIRFSRAALDAVHADCMEAPEADRPLDPTAEGPRLRDRLEMKGIGFAYPGAPQPALDGLDLDIRANTTVGIVGGTGAGKTTAMDIILGLLTPQEGVLEVDGRPVADPDARRAWRRRLGYVPQQIFLADDTVAANIAFGQKPEKIDMAAVEHAARLAQLHDFVMAELPEGYDAFVGERGVRLSGGQRQRIGIARALYHDPDVLVLDEATSALDNVTERAVMEAVAALEGSKTVIMVAHRLSTVRGCDEIFLLEHGRVAARGRYDELIERSDAFREMARSVA